MSRVRSLAIVCSLISHDPLLKFFIVIWYGNMQIWLNRSESDHESFNYWASVSESHTSAFNVEFCLYSTSVCCGQHGQLSLSIVSHTVTATTLSCPILSPSSNKTMSSSETMIDGVRVEGWPLRLGRKEQLHPNILHSPSGYNIICCLAVHINAT